MSLEAAHIMQRAASEISQAADRISNAAHSMTYPPYPHNRAERFEHAVQVLVRMHSMVAENQMRAHQGQAPAYVESHFLELLNQRY